MPGRIQEYLVHGEWHRGREHAVLTSPSEIRAAVAVCRGTVPVGYYVATARHETDLALNERDTEESGYQSWGVYQLSPDEAREVGLGRADLLALGPATLVMVLLAQRRRIALRAAAGITGADPPDMLAYLALAHNEGLGAALRSVRLHGLDWTAYTRRNPESRIIRYGSDCMAECRG